MHISNFSDVPTISKKCSHLIVTGLGRPGLPPCWNDIASTAIGSAAKIFKILTFKFSYYLQSPNTILIFEIPFFQNFDIKKNTCKTKARNPHLHQGSQVFKGLNMKHMSLSGKLYEIRCFLTYNVIGNS